MKMSDSNKIKELTQNQYKRNPRRSVSACFRSIRRQKRFDLRGDYPLLATINSAIQEIGIHPNIKQVNYAFNQSEELKALSKGMKSELLKQLMNPSSAGLKKQNSPHITAKDKKTNNITFKKDISQ